jgi:hypothetical protein
VKSIRLVMERNAAVSRYDSVVVPCAVRGWCSGAASDDEA